MALRRPMASMTGAASATTAKCIRNQRNTFLLMWLEPTISTKTEPGPTSRTMGPCGDPLASTPTGLPITMDTGSGLSPGDGLGSTMLRGDLLHPTMAAGFTPAAIGDGRPVRGSLTFV